MTNENKKQKVINYLTEMRDWYLELQGRAEHGAQLCARTGQDSGFKSESEYREDLVYTKSVYDILNGLAKRVEALPREDLSNEDIDLICKYLKGVGNEDNLRKGVERFYDSPKKKVEVTKTKDLGELVVQLQNCFSNGQEGSFSLGDHFIYPVLEIDEHRGKRTYTHVREKTSLLTYEPLSKDEGILKIHASEDESVPTEDLRKWKINPKDANLELVKDGDRTSISLRVTCKYSGGTLKIRGNRSPPL